MKRSLRLLMRRHGLLERLERLQVLLSVQIETLPLGNESWLDTEREWLLLSAHWSASQPLIFEIC